MKTAKITLSVDISQLERGLQKAGVQLNNFQKTVSGIGSGAIVDGGSASVGRRSGGYGSRPMRDVYGTSSTISSRMRGFSNATASAITGGPIGAVSGLLGLAGLGAVGAGVNALYQRRTQQAKEDSAMRALTGSVVGGESSMEFSQAERRARGLQIGRGMARGMSGAELTGAVDQGEMLEKFFNVGGETQAGFLGAATKSGDPNAMRTMSQIVANAMAVGLEKAKVPDLLEATTGFLSQISMKADVSTGAVSRFMGGLMGSSFFGKDPRRAAEAAAGLNSAFSGGDRFQQAMAVESLRMGKGMGNLSPEGAELVRMRGLFADPLKKSLLSVFDNPATVAAMKQKPEERIENLIKANMMRFSGANKDANILGLATSLDQKSPDALITMIEKVRKGGSLTPKDAAELKRGASPFSESDKKILDLNVSIDNLIKTLSEQIAPPLAGMVGMLNGSAAAKFAFGAAPSGIGGGPASAGFFAAGKEKVGTQGGTFNPDTEFFDVVIGYLKSMAGYSQRTAKNTEGVKVPPGGTGVAKKVGRR